jgi:IS4 transposase
MKLHVHVKWSIENLFKERAWEIGFSQSPETNKNFIFLGIFVAMPFQR